MTTTISRLVLLSIFTGLFSRFCLAIPPVTDSIYLSISDFGPWKSQDGCVQACLGPYDNIWGPRDLRNVLGCGGKVRNKCYCALTGAGAASSYLSECISGNCAKGDLPDQVTSGISVFDLYCLTAGYSLPGAGAWVAATPTPEPPPTQTQPEAPSRTQAPTVFITKTEVTTPDATSKSSSSSLLGSTPGSSAPIYSLPGSSSPGFSPGSTLKTETATSFSQTTTLTSSTSLDTPGAGGMTGGLSSEAIIGIVFGLVGVIAAIIAGWTLQHMIKVRKEKLARRATLLH